MSVLTTQPRTQSGTRAAFALRREGMIPAVIYGEGRPSESIAISEKEFETALRHHERVVDLEVGGEKQKALIHEVQWDHMGDHLLHVDFLRVAKGHTVEVAVELEFVGHPRGLSHGGEFMKQLSDLRITCLPDAIPEVILVQVGDLDLHDAIHVRELSLPGGVQALHQPDDLVCSIHSRAAEVEAAEEGEGEGESEGEGAEPEVISKGKGEAEPGAEE